MSEPPEAEEHGPTLTILAEDVSAAAEPYSWLIQWVVRNTSSDPVTLLSVRIPHDQFRAEDRRLEPTLEIPSESSSTLPSRVRCAEPANSTLTYPFLILQTRWRNRDWRCFTRLRIEIDPDGVPRPVCEETTAQAVGSGRVVE